MTEARSSERMRVFLRAQIVFNDNRSTVDCSIRNMSSTGAKLELSQAVTVPGEFDLLIPQKGTRLRAKMRWRTTDAVGVEFIKDTQPVRQPGKDLAGRVRELEIENAQLRLKVLELTARLEQSGTAHPEAA
ncbi:MAG: PilZ domain-containing protein [Methylobacteriaceae bacterium]|nr:PilZ domain-containing protein [Methylobacteriaceae bacterium]